MSAEHAFSQKELHAIFRRAERMAESEVCRGAEEAGRGVHARMWLALADAASGAHAFLVREAARQESATRVVNDYLPGDGPRSAEDEGYGFV